MHSGGARDFSHCHAQREGPRMSYRLLLPVAVAVILALHPPPLHGQARQYRLQYLRQSAGLYTGPSVAPVPAGSSASPEQPRPNSQLPAALGAILAQRLADKPAARETWSRARGDHARIGVQDARANYNAMTAMMQRLVAGFGRLGATGAQRRPEPGFLAPRRCRGTLRGGQSGIRPAPGSADAHVRLPRGGRGGDVPPGGGRRDLHQSSRRSGPTAPASSMSPQPPSSIRRKRGSPGSPSPLPPMRQWHWSATWRSLRRCRRNGASRRRWPPGRSIRPCWGSSSPPCPGSSLLIQDLDRE